LAARNSPLHELHEMFGQPDGIPRGYPTVRK